MQNQDNIFSFYTTAKPLSSLVPVLWPVTRFDFKIQKPSVPSSLNLFERVVLKLIGLNHFTCAELAQLTCLDELLIHAICQRLLDFQLITPASNLNQQHNRINHRSNNNGDNRRDSSDSSLGDIGCNYQEPEPVEETLTQSLLDFSESNFGNEVGYCLTPSGKQEFKRLQANNGASNQEFESFYILREDLTGRILPYTLRLSHERPHTNSTLSTSATSTTSPEQRYSTQPESAQENGQPAETNAQTKAEPETEDETKFEAETMAKTEGVGADLERAANANGASIDLHHLSRDLRNNIPIYRFGSITSDDWISAPVELHATHRGQSKVLPRQVKDALQECQRHYLSITQESRIPSANNNGAGVSNADLGNSTDFSGSSNSANHLLNVQRGAGNDFAHHMYISNAETNVFSLISSFSMYLHCACTIDRKVLDPCGLPEYSNLLTQILQNTTRENSQAFQFYVSQNKDKLQSHASNSVPGPASISVPATTSDPTSATAQVSLESAPAPESGKTTSNTQTQSQDQDQNQEPTQAKTAAQTNLKLPGDAPFNQDLMVLTTQYAALVSAEQADDLLNQEKPFADLTILLYNHFDFTLRDLLTFVKTQLPEISALSSQELAAHLQLGSPVENGKMIREAESSLGFKNLDRKLQVQTKQLLQAWDDKVSSPKTTLALILLLTNKHMPQALAKRLAKLASLHQGRPLENLQQIHFARNASSHAERFSSDMQSSTMLSNWCWLLQIMQLTYPEPQIKLKSQTQSESQTKNELQTQSAPQAQQSQSILNHAAASTFDPTFADLAYVQAQYARTQALDATLKQLEQQPALTQNIWPNSDQTIIWLNEYFDDQEVRSLHSTIYHVAQDNLYLQSSGETLVSDLYQVTQDLLLKLIEQSPLTKDNFAQLKGCAPTICCKRVVHIAKEKVENAGLLPQALAAQSLNSPHHLSNFDNLWAIKAFFVNNALAKDPKNHNTSVGAAFLVFVLLTPLEQLKQLQDCDFLATISQLLTVRGHNQTTIGRAEALQLQDKLFTVFKALLQILNSYNNNY